MHIFDKSIPYSTVFKHSSFYEFSCEPCIENGSQYSQPCGLTVHILCSSIGCTDLMLFCIGVLRQAHVRHSEECRQESRDLEMSLLLSLFLSGGLYFWNQHMLAPIGTQKIWGKSYIIYSYNSPRRKYSILSSMPIVLCWFYSKNFNVRFVFSYISGCSNGIIGLNQICCRCKCIIVYFQVLSFIRTCFWNCIHNEWLHKVFLCEMHVDNPAICLTFLFTGLTFCFICAAWKCGCDSEAPS